MWYKKNNQLSYAKMYELSIATIKIPEESTEVRITNSASPQKKIRYFDK